MTIYRLSPIKCPNRNKCGPDVGTQDSDEEQRIEEKVCFSLRYRKCSTYKKHKEQQVKDREANSYYRRPPIQ